MRPELPGAAKAAPPAPGRPQPARERKPVRAGGPGPREVDEDLLVRRYVKAGWTIAACARAAKVTNSRARRILLAHGVQLRGKPLPGDDAVIAAYQRHNSMHTVAVMLGTSDAKVKEILAAHGIGAEPRQRSGLGSLQGVGTARPPGQAPLLTLAAAMDVLHRSGKFVKQAAADGRIRTERDEHGRIRYNRDDIDAIAAGQACPSTLRRSSSPSGAPEASSPPGWLIHNDEAAILTATSHDDDGRAEARTHGTGPATACQMNEKLDALLNASRVTWPQHAEQTRNPSDDGRQANRSP